jgi:hypothetical protein
MNFIERLIHGFRRSVIFAERTFPIVDLSASHADFLLEKASLAKFDGEMLVGYFLDAGEWTAIFCGGLIWSSKNQTGALSIEEIDAAKVDLKINKKLANAKSLAECKFVTITSKVGAQFNVSFENGSTAIAGAAIVGELIKKNRPLI